MAAFACLPRPLPRSLISDHWRLAEAICTVENSSLAVKPLMTPTGKSVWRYGECLLAASNQEAGASMGRAD